MELKFIVGMMIVGIGFALMVSTDTKNVSEEIVAVRHYDKSRVQREPVLSARSYARNLVSAEEYKFMYELIMLESSWNPDAQNKKSTAYGLGQFLDKTWDLVGIEKSSDYRVQLVAMHKYVMDRYGSWVKALEFRKANGYY